MTRERWMALFFALGSTCFLIGPFPGYAQLVGGRADAVTFFIGSLLFTAGGALQTLIAFPERHSSESGRAAWWAAAVQSAGTLFFNVTTYQALDTAPEPRRAGGPCRSLDEAARSRIHPVCVHGIPFPRAPPE